MSAAKTYDERFEAKQEAARRKGAQRRSWNTRPHTVVEVRGTFQDAIVQIGRLAERQNRPELRVLRDVLRRLRDVVAEKPTTRPDMIVLLRGLEHLAFERRWDRTSRPSGEYEQPHLYVHVTHDGLEQLRQAVEDRVHAGALPKVDPAKPLEQRSKPLPGALRKLVDDALANPLDDGAAP